MFIVHSSLMVRWILVEILDLLKISTKTLKLLLCLVSYIRYIIHQVPIIDFILLITFSVQSFGRDFGSASELDYPILAQTKARARELIIEWLFDAIEEDNPTPTPPVPLVDAVAY